MALLEIKKFPDKVLLQRSSCVPAVTDAQRKLVRDMLDTMYFAKGVGLAAVQVGVPTRIIVCNPTGEAGDEIALINPRVIYRKGAKVRDCEGCLSVPGVTAEVNRYRKIGVVAQDINGRQVAFDAEDLLARIFDHEIDHLDGVLFIDRIGFFRRRRLLNAYRKKLGIQCVGRWY